MKDFLTPARRERILADMKPLHVLLTDWLDEVKLTPAEGARRCGLSAQLFYQLKSGETSNPRASTLLKLSDGTGIPLERLALASDMRSTSVTPPRQLATA
jgi:transcriptional regulator with XRE-family HTH domain